MITLHDQLGRNIHLQTYPQRIISLVPSQTELLFDLGLEKEVAGITKFCVHPHEWYRNKAKVGGTKTITIDRIHALNPDLIIANKEENTKIQIEELAARYPVWISDVNDLETALQMINSIGELTNRVEKASQIYHQIDNAFASFSTRDQPTLNTAYLIWKDPFMVAGGGTFINSMLQTCGLKNIFGQLARYPEIKISDLHSRNNGCDLLLLSSEPYPFSQKHIQELQIQLPGTKIMLVNGEMFSWYGSRLRHAPGYFEKLLADIHGL